MAEGNGDRPQTIHDYEAQLRRTFTGGSDDEAYLPHEDVRNTVVVSGAQIVMAHQVERPASVPMETGFGD